MLFFDLKFNKLKPVAVEPAVTNIEKSDSLSNIKFIFNRDTNCKVYDESY